MLANCLDLYHSMISASSDSGAHATKPPSRSLWETMLAPGEGRWTDCPRALS